MIVWVITTGEQLPDFDGKNVRLWRSVMLTNALIEKGHSVIRWTACIDHTTKKQRFDKNTIINVTQSYQIIFLKTPGYKKNISIQRFRDHKVLAIKFKELAVLQVKPDIILCSLPTIELCLEASIYGKSNNIPVILDGRDMWPDLFADFLPKPFRPLMKWILYPMFRDVKRACMNSYALSGISQPYIDWEVNYAGRNITFNDKYFPHGYTAQSPTEFDKIEGFQFWKKYNIDDKSEFIVCLFSAMGNVIDIDTLINAAKILKKRSLPIRFVLCGDGDKLSEFKNKAKRFENILFTGWVNFNQIWTLMRLSKVGILPYFDIDNYKFNIPNKPIEYLSAGLPIISGVRGLIENLIVENNCGKVFTTAEQLAGTLIELYQNQSLLKTLSVNAFKIYQEKFIAEKVYSEMANYLINTAEQYKKTNEV